MMFAWCSFLFVLELYIMGKTKQELNFHQFFAWYCINAVLASIHAWQALDISIKISSD